MRNLGQNIVVINNCLVISNAFQKYVSNNTIVPLQMVYILMHIPTHFWAIYFESILSEALEFCTCLCVRVLCHLRCDFHDHWSYGPKASIHDIVDWPNNTSISITSTANTQL